MADDGEREALELQKLGLEVDALRKKKKGREKLSLWQKAQYVITYLGILATTGTIVVGYLTYRNSVATRQLQDLQKALDLYKEGWLPSVVALGRHGSEGVRALVRGIHPVPDPREPHWPELTLATLDELQQRKDLLQRDDERFLLDARDRNRQELRLAIASLEQNPEAPELQQLPNLMCVQLKLQKLAGVPGDKEWTDIVEAYELRFSKLPDC